MIRYEPAQFGQSEWNAIIASFEPINLMQDWAYGEAKAQTGGWHTERGILSQDNKFVGAAQVLIKSIPVIGGGLAWLNRGPLHQEGLDVRELLTALATHYSLERGLYLRIAPPIGADEFSAVSLKDTPLQNTDTSGWASAVLDLSTDIEDLRTGLRQNWRNALNKAERGGVTIDAGEDIAFLDGFLDEYRTFLDDRKITTSVSADLLRSLHHLRLPGTKLKCFRARSGNTQLGSVLVARTGYTAEYLAGTLLEAGRPYSVGQLLLWHAICDAKESGMRNFDLGGMDPELTPKGVYEFKRGVGGTAFRLAPELEATPNGLSASLIRWVVRRHRIGHAT